MCFCVWCAKHNILSCPTQTLGRCLVLLSSGQVSFQFTFNCFTGVLQLCWAKKSLQAVPELLAHTCTSHPVHLCACIHKYCTVLNFVLVAECVPVCLLVIKWLSTLFSAAHLKVEPDTPRWSSLMSLRVGSSYTYFSCQRGFFQIFCFISFFFKYLDC